MEVEKTEIDGVLLVKPKVWNDARGYFLETWQERRYKEIGIDLPFVQDNSSSSTKGTLRGLHYQKRFAQGKLVMVSLGEIFDVAVDIRKDSKTFGKWVGFNLNDKNHYQLWIPPGLAHGFMVISDLAHFHYKCTEYYHPEEEGSVLWNDPDLNIKWPQGLEVILSEKDKKAPLLKDI